MTEHIPERPGRFTVVGNLDAGTTHLALDGANGERVAVTETYEDPRSAENALQVIVRTVLTTEYTLRGNRDLTEVASFEDHIERVTAELLKEA